MIEHQTITHTLLTLSFFLGGACLGTALLRVINHYPQYLMIQWQHECALHNKMPPPPPFQLRCVWQRPHCTDCHVPHRLIHSLPIIGFFLSKGGCEACLHPRTRQAPLVEGLTACITTAIFLYSGYSLTSCYALLSACFFIVLSVIDYNERILPDLLTLGFLWIGLVIGLAHSQRHAVLGAVVGYSVPWLFNQLYQFLRKRPGMGQGDFKLLASIGAWAGAAGAVLSYFSAACLSVLVALPLLLMQRLHLRSQLAFGPFLCVTGWICIYFNHSVSSFFNHIVMGY